MKKLVPCDFDFWQR